MQSALKISFVLAKKVGFEKVLAQGALQMCALQMAKHPVLKPSGSRIALVSTDWTILTMLAKMGAENTSLPL